MGQMTEQIKIEYVPINNLRPAEYNPRRLTPKQADDLTKSMEKFGAVDPIIVNRHPGREGIVVGGHQRLKIAKKLKWDTVPVVYVDLDESQEKELNLRLNKNTGEWDFDLLADFNAGMVLDVGWSQEETDDIFQLNTVELNEPKDTKLAIGSKKSAEVKPVFYVEQIETLERAMAETGETNRNQAFMKICEFYLENNKKR